MTNKLFLIIFLIGCLCASCLVQKTNNSANVESNSDIKTENSLPVSLGDSREKVNTTLGTPYITGDNFESYSEYGLVIDYDLNDKVISICATLLNSGVSFDGKIFGVALGDDVSVCTNKWGHSVKWEETPFEYNIAEWRYEGNSLELEIWLKDGNDSSFGSYKKGTVKQITLKK